MTTNKNIDNNFLIAGFSDYFSNVSSYNARFIITDLFLHAKAEPYPIAYANNLTYANKLDYFFNWFSYFFNKYSTPIKFNDKLTISNKHPLRGIKRPIQIKDYLNHHDNIVGLHNHFKPKHDLYLLLAKSLKPLHDHNVTTTYTNNGFGILDNLPDDLLHFAKLLNKDCLGEQISPSATLTFTNSYELINSFIKRLNDVNYLPKLLVNGDELNKYTLDGIIKVWATTYANRLDSFITNLMPLLVSYISLLQHVYYVNQSLIVKHQFCLNIFEKLYHE